MSKDKNTEQLDALIFIDTNILLGFYKITGNNETEFLNIINDNIKHFIITEQVEMEFFKNRSNVLDGMLKNFKKPDTNNLNLPQFFRKEYGECIKKYKTYINKKFKKINDSLIANFKLIKDSPEENDGVFKNLIKIFENNNLIKIDDDKNDDIFTQARMRFEQGMPPRKDKDNSIGDAINWESCLHLAAKNDKNLIIVTADGDFGKNGILNDWLKKEFTSRVGDNRKIKLTNMLSDAFYYNGIPISKDARKAEKEAEEAKKMFESISIKQDGECMRCGTPALFDAICNDCGGYVLGDEDGANYYLNNENGIMYSEGIDGEYTDPVVCFECNSKNIEIGYHRFCSYCAHMHSKY